MPARRRSRVRRGRCRLRMSFNVAPIKVDAYSGMRRFDIFHKAHIRKNFEPQIHSDHMVSVGAPRMRPYRLTIMTDPYGQYQVVGLRLGMPRIEHLRDPEMYFSACY